MGIQLLMVISIKRFAHTVAATNVGLCFGRILTRLNNCVDCIFARVITHAYHVAILFQGPGWLMEVGSWIT